MCKKRKKLVSSAWIAEVSELLLNLESSDPTVFFFGIEEHKILQ